MKEEILEKLWEEVRELSLGSATTAVERLHSPPSPLDFLRRFVSPNKPCLISNATLHWPAASLWSSSDAHLLRALSSAAVSLHVTPSGAADSLTPHPSDPSSLCFASAHVHSMPFPLALQAIYASDLGAKFVAYAQQQNDCFRSEYSALKDDCEPHIPWATEALGCLPEAVNLWIGNELSQTSFHKDHYENLYAVVTGEKHFLLLPPTDFHRMYIREYPAAHYSYSEETGEFKVEIEDPVRYVPWCSVDPYPTLERREREKCQNFLCISMDQSHSKSQLRPGKFFTWYDMQFDIKYAYFNFLQSIPLPSSHDLTLHEVSCGSSTDASICNSGGESDVNAVESKIPAENNDDSEVE